MDELLQDFIAETRETLDALSGEIVAWEADPGDRGRLDAIFRFVHTVKGSCGFLDLPRLARLSHAAEDVLAAVRDGNRAPDAALVSAVLAIVDRIGELVEAIDSEIALDDSGEDMLIAALERGAVAAIPAPSTGQRAPSRSVRLNVELLDRMMSGMSDMVLARNELARRLREGTVDPSLESALERLSATVADMREAVTRTRMQTIEALFSALPRMVRDTAGALGKAVQLTVEGSDVELDREMIEVMRDPLVHIIRNAIDHGIEAPALRRLAGKRETGRLSVSARQSGNQIIVEVADDGAGIDVDRIIAKLSAAGRDRHALMTLSDKAKLELIFEPGLSTRDTVTEISGRGVGMDVVRASVEQIGGRIELENAPGKGMRIAIHVPLTLSIISTIVVGCGDQRFALPRQAIEEIVSDRAEAIRVDRLGDSDVATVRERRMPMVDLASQLGLPRSGPAVGRKLVIVGVGAGSYAIAVDTVLDTEELVIKPAAPSVMASGLYAGQTLPDTGLPMLLIDCAGLAADAGLVFAREVVEEAAVAAEAPGTPMMVFRDLDDAIRAIPLALVDRVESVAAAAIRHVAGRLRMVVDGRILPLAALGDVDGQLRVGVLRLKDGASEVGYAMAEPIDIVAIDAECAPAATPGPIAGVILHQGEQIELLDPFWLFAAHTDATAIAHAAAPLCLIDAADEWMASFVRPMLERAGYRVATEAPPGERAAAMLTFAMAEAGHAADAPIVRLRHSASSGDCGASVYRYDRGGILAAIDRVAAKAARA